MMQVGAVFPQTEIGPDPAAIRSWAQAVEGLGYRHVVAWDHALGAGVDARPDWQGYFTSNDAFHEIFVLFGYLAAVTTTLELVTGILILPQGLAEHRDALMASPGVCRSTRRASPNATPNSMPEA
jgi:alkanesulfonate monooxygenase SsuD/methylene tetrahydromethanopterin reductase-like flavin-dependent oxidoreductase (luciferase family)